MGPLEAALRRIDELEAENKRLTIAFTLACQEVVETDEGNCPGCPKDNKINFPNGCDIPREKYAECWQKHFLKLAEKELNAGG